MKVCDKKNGSNYLWGGQYSAKKNMRFKSPVLIWDLCDYSVVKGRISVTGADNANRRNKKLTLKNNASIRSCILKTNNTFIGNAEDLDNVMLIYNILEHSDNYSMTSGSLWITEMK